MIQKSIWIVLVTSLPILSLTVAYIFVNPAMGIHAANITKEAIENMTINNNTITNANFTYLNSIDIPLLSTETNNVTIDKPFNNTNT